MNKCVHFRKKIKSKTEDRKVEYHHTILQTTQISTYDFSEGIFEAHLRTNQIDDIENLNNTLLWSQCKLTWNHS